MSDLPATQAETQPKPRRNRIAEEKAALRTQLEALVNKVPAAVNSGSIQTTREWVSDNTSASRAACRVRTSKRQLQQALDKLQGWREEAGA